MITLLSFPIGVFWIPVILATISATFQTRYGDYIDR